MCGIVGAASTRDVVDVLIEGIKKLEYRGYDSAGIAFLKEGRLDRLRSTGRVARGTWGRMRKRRGPCLAEAADVEGAWEAGGG